MNKGILMVIDTGSSHGVASLIFCPLFCIFENMQLKMYKYFSFPSCYVLRTCCQLVYEYNSELKKKHRINKNKAVHCLFHKFMEIPR